MCGSKVIPVCIFNKLQAVSPFLALTTPARIPIPSQSTEVSKMMLSSSVMKAYSLFQQWLRVHPIRAHGAVATQCMPWGLLNTDYGICENISHVGLWGILWACI